jgi:hypothetical protein
MIATNRTYRPEFVRIRIKLLSLISQTDLFQNAVINVVSEIGLYEASHQSKFAFSEVLVINNCWL